MSFVSQWAFLNHASQQWVAILLSFMLLMYQDEVLAVRIRGAVRSQGHEEDITVRAVYDTRYTGVLISRELANTLKPDLSNGTTEVLWFEEGTSKSRRDQLWVNEKLPADMVMGKDMAQHLEEGRLPVVAPIFPVKSKGKQNYWRWKD
jgi:hypothetical protein